MNQPMQQKTTPPLQPPPTPHPISRVPPLLPRIRTNRLAQQRRHARVLARRKRRPHPIPAPPARHLRLLREQTIAPRRRPRRFVGRAPIRRRPPLVSLKLGAVERRERESPDGAKGFVTAADEESLGRALFALVDGVEGHAPVNPVLFFFLGDEGHSVPCKCPRHGYIVFCDAGIWGEIGVWVW